MKSNSKATIKLLTAGAAVAFGLNGSLPAQAAVADDDVTIQVFLNPGEAGNSGQTFSGKVGKNSISIPTGELTAGPNLIAFRVKEADSNYSTAYTRLIFVDDTQGCAGAEYAIDNDVTPGSGTPVNGKGNIITFNVPTGNLSIGAHTLFARVISADGEWSPTVSRPFVVTGNGTNIEWFFDTDPGVGKGHFEYGSTGKNIIFLPTEGLTPGAHVISFRAHDKDKNVSPTYTRLIYAAERLEISAMEYFIDTDPGAGKGSPVMNPENSTISFSVPTANLAAGTHTLTLRGKNEATGQWVDLFVSPFTVTGLGGIVSSEWERDFKVIRESERIMLTFIGENPASCQVSVHSLNGSLIYSGTATDTSGQLSIDVPASVSPVIISVQWPDNKRSVRTIR